MNDLIILVISLLLWVFAFLGLKKIKMNFFKFMVGSLGLFTIAIVFLSGFLETGLSFAISNSLSIIEKYTDYFQVFAGNSIITMDTKSGIVSMLINYECSGVIEMLVFTSLAIFFPFGSVLRKSFTIVAGNAYIYISNIVRIMSIIFITKTFGAEAYYVAHTLIARIIFFALMLLLYYFVFTFTQMKYQNVGDIK